MQLYLQNAHFKGRGLSIVTDCSYSGCWVKEALAFMDKQNVGPCAHTAKEKGILVEVFASCLANEIPAELAFSTHGAKNDKNIGTLAYTISLWGEKIYDGQHPSGVNFTEVRCKSKIDELCTMAPGQQWSTAQRVMTIKGKDKGRPAWCYLLLVDDEESFKEFCDKCKEGSADVDNYGQVLMSGLGQEPPKEADIWIEEHYRVNYNYQAPSEATD